MNGFELYTEMRKVDEEVKVCFITAGEIYYDEVRNERQEEQEGQEEEPEEVKQYCKLDAFTKAHFKCRPCQKYRENTNVK